MSTESEPERLDILVGKRIEDIALDIVKDSFPIFFWEISQSSSIIGANIIYKLDLDDLFGTLKSTWCGCFKRHVKQKAKK